MSKFILFTNSVINARYDSEIHGEREITIVDAEPVTIKNPNCKIPDEAIEVSEDIFRKTIDEQDGIWSLVDGAIVKLPFPAPTLAELKKSKLAEINADFNKATEPITSGIPDIELKSWQKQEDEARAYIANNSSITPLIDALALSRSVNKAELVSRIIAKADLFAGISGTLIGRRQALEDELNALPESATPEDIAAITWS